MIGGKKKAGEELQIGKRGFAKEVRETELSSDPEDGSNVDEDADYSEEGDNDEEDELENVGDKQPPKSKPVAKMNGLKKADKESEEGKRTASRRERSRRGAGGRRGGGRRRRRRGGRRRRSGRGQSVLQHDPRHREQLRGRGHGGLQERRVPHGARRVGCGADGSAKCSSTGTWWCRSWDGATSARCGWLATSSTTRTCPSRS